MNLGNKYATDLTSKDKNIAISAAKHIIETADMEAWKCFVENSDSIFDFIKQNIGKYFAEVIDENNYKNLYKLFRIHSFDWDECFVQILLRFSYSNEDLHQKMLDLLENGTEDEKTYAAKYFSFVPEPKANFFLADAYKINYEPLKYNAAKALGDAGDLYSYNYYINALSADDDWTKIDAAQFIQWYGNKKALPKILNAMENSAMPEHIAGSAAMLDNISHYFASDDENLRKLSLKCYSYIIDSIGEVWPLSAILDFELYDCVEKLIELINQNNIPDLTSLFATLLLKTRQQFFKLNSEEYKFDEDKKTLELLDGIIELLEEGSENFWKSCEKELEKELDKTEATNVIQAINVIAGSDLKYYAQKLKTMLEVNKDETILYEIIQTLKQIDNFYGVDTESLLNKISDFNIKAAAEVLLKK